MKITKYRQKILELTKKYYEEFDKEDFSHNSDHFFRVENVAKRITEDEKADLEIVEAACLLFDIARGMEDRKEIENHAKKGAEIAREILTQIDFPKEKIEKVCDAILTHRRSRNIEPQTLEAKILRDADYLDAMGAINVIRVIASSLQSKKYKRPIFVDKPYEDRDDIGYTSAYHFMLYEVKHPKHQPESFYTKLGRKLAEDRLEFSKEYIERLDDERRGDR
jgi:uncharacterized protein